jgi:hypothetical protein
LFLAFLKDRLSEVLDDVLEKMEEVNEVEEERGVKRERIELLSRVEL